MDRLDNKSFRFRGGLILLICLICIVSFVISYQSNKTLQLDDLAKVDVTLKNKPHYHDYNIGDNSYKDLIIQTNEFKDSFAIDGLQLKLTNLDSVLKMQQNMRFWVLLEKDYKESLNRAKKISLFSFGSASITYLDIDKLNAKRKDYRGTAYSISLCLLALIPFLLTTKRIRYLEIKALALISIWTYLLYLIFGFIK